MQVPKIPQDEAQRLAALKDYDIIDTLPEEPYDDLTLLASQICGTPIALVSLIDENRQWFKSHHGIDVKETPRDLAFCAHAIHGVDPFIVEDASVDSRFSDNPLVSGPTNVRFYAGAPLTTPEGYTIGTLCVIDQTPKVLTPQQITALQALARKVVAELERRKAYARLHRTKTSLDAAQRLTKIGSWEWDFIAGKMSWSENQYALFGRDRSFVLSLDSYYSHLLPKDAAALKTAIEKAVHNRAEYSLEHSIMRGDGSRRIVVEMGRVECDAEGRPLRLLSTTQDVTASREADLLIKQQQLKLLNAARMAALGEMAGGIAHEINNPLAIVSGKANLLKRSLAVQPIDQERFGLELDRIEVTVQRMAKIIRGLLSFARNSERDPMVPADLAQILADTLELCRQKIQNQGITLRIDASEPLLVTCRGGQIAQILINLLNNAFDAVEMQEEKWIEIKTEVKGDATFISITDSGRGIDPGVVDKMMQPFFTTKGVGKGTGLGLSISNGLAEEHGGSLRYDSSSEHTRFTLEIPSQRSNLRPQAA